MSVVELTEFLIKNLVTDPENVSVKEMTGEDENQIIIQVVIDEQDMGRVIGRGGKTANSIRNIVQASSYLKDNKRITINIDAI